MTRTIKNEKSATDSKSFLNRVRFEMHRLHPSERRLAEFVSDFPGELASYSATELAELANVSNATVSRFIKRLGYKNYEQARRQVRAEKRTGSRFYLTPSDSGKIDRSIDAHVLQSQENLQRTFQKISEIELKDVAKSFLKARKIWVIGFRTSHSFATYLQWQAIQVVENITVIPGGGETLGEHMASIQNKDLVVIFGLRRRVSRLSTIIKYVKKSGARLLYITDEGVPKNRTADWHFKCDTQAPGPLFNHVSVMSICHLLVTRIIEQSGASGRKRLTNIESVNDSLDELSNE